MELTKEHLEILKHAAKNGLYCGDSKEMQELCDCKMMEYAGRKSFVPDPYFRLGPDGKSAVEDMAELGMLESYAAKDFDCASCRIVENGCPQKGTTCIPGPMRATKHDPYPGSSGFYGQY